MYLGSFSARQQRCIIWFWKINGHENNCSTDRLDKIVNYKQSLGSRKTREDLFQEVVNKHNRQAIGKAKLSNVEVSALAFFDMAPPEVKKICKVIWGTEVPSSTALPLSVISLPFLQPRKSLSSRFSSETNALWHNIATHSWAKIEEFLNRLAAKWDAKIEEYHAKGQVAPVSHPQISASFRDSGKEAELLLMAGFMVHFADDLKTLLGQVEYDKLVEAWRCGNMDRRLMPEIVACRPDFRITDLGLAVGNADGAALPASFEVDDEEKMEQVRSLIALTRNLAKEQQAMRTHKAAVNRYSAASLAAETEFQKSVEDMVTNLWHEHSLYYTCLSAKTLSAASGALAQSHISLTGRLLVESKDVPIIGMVNVPMLGAAASSNMRAIVAHISSELTSKPATCVYLVFPPNQVEFGSGRQKSNRDENLAAHQALWKAELDSCMTIKVLNATALFDEQSMYSDDRDLGFQFWIVVAASVADDLPKKNVFGSSTLLKRKAVPGLLPTMQRVDMSNFWKDLSFAQGGTTNRDMDAERRQHFSGKGFHSQILMCLFANTKLKTKNTVMVHEVTLYDAELAKAVVGLNACKPGTASGMKTWPSVAYAGVCWAANAGVKDVVVKNVSGMLEGEVKGMITRGEYAMAELPPGMLSKSADPQTKMPSLDESAFHLCIPTPGQELVWLKSTMDKGQLCGNTELPDSEVWKGQCWQDIVASHNAEFNKSGLVRNKREADISVEECLS